jgi:hypothetical protein
MPAWLIVPWMSVLWMVQSQSETQPRITGNAHAELRFVISRSQLPTRKIAACRRDGRS